MDLNLATTTTTALVNNSNQENNQLLLNAIKNKFAAQTAQEAAAFSPPKFNIPLLKIPTTANASTENTNTHGSSTPPQSQLNQFLLKQLQDKHTNSDGVDDQQKTGFVLPQLQINNNNTNKSALKFELPLLKQAATQKDNHSKISSLTTAINKLQVQEDAAQLPPTIPPSINIDLTTALASKRQTHQGTPPTRDFIKSATKSNPEDLDFVIPFIDCDRLDNSSRKHDLLLPLSNEYCITDISQLLLKHSFVEEPSAIGRFLCLADNKYSPPEPLKYLSAEYRQQPVKHFIAPFRFETKSPDDMVQEALNKYQMRHYN